MDIEKLKAALRSFTPEQIQAGILERKNKQRAQVQAAIDRHIHSHARHGLPDDFEQDIEYFDAMFVSMQVKCGCGGTFTVTREMME
jgi:hypothetical protein